MRSLKVLEQGGREAVGSRAPAGRGEGRGRGGVGPRRAPEKFAANFSAVMPDRYFLTVPEGDIRLHFTDGRVGRAPGLPIGHFPELELANLCVAPHNKPGLFSKIAGVLTADDLNILSARITTPRRRYRAGRRFAYRTGHRQGRRWTRSEIARRARPRAVLAGEQRHRGSPGAQRQARWLDAIRAPRRDRDYGRQPQLRAIHGFNVFTQDRSGCCSR